MQSPAASQSKNFLAKLVSFGQTWFDLGKTWLDLGKISEKVIRFGQKPQILHLQEQPNFYG